MDLFLAGKHALITGGSKGIGRATAELLAEEGVDVTLVARDPAALAQAADAVRARRQVKVVTIAADLSREEEVLRVAAEADGKCDRKSPSANVLAMNFASDTIHRVTELNMDIHGRAGAHMHAHTDKLVRDGIIWTHLAGDSVQRMKAVDRLRSVGKP